MVEIQKHLYSIADFDAYRQQEAHTGRLLELIHGEVFEKVVTEEHGVIVVNVAAAIRAYLKENPIGRVGVEISHRPTGDRYNDRLPDISLMLGERPVVRAGSVPQMPDLAVEVKSPGNSYVALRSKAEYMLQNGTQVVWLIDPARRAVEVCTLTDQAAEPRSMRVETLAGDALLRADALLPGFSLPLSDVFDTLG